MLDDINLNRQQQGPLETLTKESFNNIPNRSSYRSPQTTNIPIKQLDLSTRIQSKTSKP